MILFPEVLGRNAGKLPCSHLPLSGRDRKPTGKEMPLAVVCLQVSVSFSPLLYKHYALFQAEFIDGERQIWIHGVDRL